MTLTYATNLLQVIDLAFNALTSPIPIELEYLPNIMAILLEGNQLSGSILVPYVIFVIAKTLLNGCFEAMMECHTM